MFYRYEPEGFRTAPDGLRQGLNGHKCVDGGWKKPLSAGRGGAMLSGCFQAQGNLDVRLRLQKSHIIVTDNVYKFSQSRFGRRELLPKPPGRCL